MTQVEGIAGLDEDASAMAGDVDGGLAVRAGHGDRAAFGELVGRNYDRIYRIAAKWCGGREEAEDVAQNVCVKLAGIVGSYDARARFSSWLYRVVLNEVRDGQRRRARQRRRDRAYAAQIPEGTSGGQEEDVLARQLWAAVRALPEKQRDAVLLVYAEEQSHAEAADVLGIGEATVSWYVHEARKALKGVLE